MALVITIIIGASIGGFGTLFENMSEELARTFLKVKNLLRERDNVQAEKP